MCVCVCAWVDCLVHSHCSHDGASCLRWFFTAAAVMHNARVGSSKYAAAAAAIMPQCGLAV
jgi:hypothetical protein